MLEKILLLRDKTKMAVRETMHKYVVHQSYHKIPKVSAGAYIIFSKAHFDRLIFAGGYVWREICAIKLARLILVGYLIVGRKFMSVILHEVFPETRSEDADLLKNSAMQNLKTRVQGGRKNLSCK